MSDRDADPGPPGGRRGIARPGGGHAPDVAGGPPRAPTGGAGAPSRGGTGAEGAALAHMAAALLAIDPLGLGGLRLRARASPARDAVAAAARAVALPARRLHPAAPVEALVGGPDPLASLAAGRLVVARGILAEPALVVLAMAERAPPALAGALAAALDEGRACVLALDEGIDGEGLHPILADRLALSVDLDAAAARDAVAPDRAGPRSAAPRRGDDPADARARLASVTASPEAGKELVALALALGIEGMRAPIQALRAARAHAAWAGRAAVTPDDLAAAAALVLAPRARTVPPEEEAGPPPPPEERGGADERAGDADRPAPEAEGGAAAAQDVVLAAMRAALPPGALEALVDAARDARGTAGARGAGARRVARRGRPLRSRPGRPSEGRVDAAATLRAAAPWQPARRAAFARGAMDAARDEGRAGSVARPVEPASGAPSGDGSALARAGLAGGADRGDASPVARLAPAGRGGPRRDAAPADDDPDRPRGAGLLLRPSDIRIRRHEDRSERLIVMAVDASGSAAAARLAEAKGAAERLLAGAYAARDHVALVTFRGAGALVALPPTRSLARARRLLAGLPGGGGTPLAAGLAAAREVMVAARARGQSPSLAVLTDGRANVALDGSASRERAAAEALGLARALRGEGPAVVIDTASRPGRARELARALGARWMPLPRSGGLPPDALRDALR